MNERLLKIQVVARKKSHLTALALAHQAHNTHHTQAVEITRGALRAGLGEVQVWTAAQAMGLTPNAVSRMLSGLSAMRELSAADGTTEARDFNKSMGWLRRLADVHAEPPKPIRAVNDVRGTALFPAALYQNTRRLDITGARARELIHNIDAQPTRTDPQQWFKFMSDQCALLGKMPTLGDLSGLIEANLFAFDQRVILKSKVIEQNFYADDRSTVFRSPVSPQAIATLAYPPGTVHDFHVAFFGTRSSTWGTGFLAGLGYSGETSAWAELMPFMDRPKQMYSRKDSLIQAFENRVGEDAGQSSPEDMWEWIKQTLETGDRAEIKEALHDDLFGAGRLTDPSVISVAKVPLATIFKTRPGTASRIAAVKELKTVLQNGPGRGGPDAGSLRAIHTEMVLVQVLSAYFEESGLASQYSRPGKIDPNQVFDLGRVHQIYQEMQQRGTLVSLDEVRAMLGRLGVSAK